MNDSINSSHTHQRLDPRGRRSFYYFLLIAGVVIAAATIIQVVWIIDVTESRVGDGVHVDSYGFDLAGFAGNRDLLVAGGLPKDGQPAMVDPDHYTIAEVDKIDDKVFKFQQLIIDYDLVIGVVIHGEARAYPIRILNWHEIVNDTLGGVPIAVTFSPVSRGAVVFDRRVAGRTLRFAYSGLFYNHALLMYDAQNVKKGSDPVLTFGDGEADFAKESLWSQMKFRAIAGPMAGKKLTVLPCELTRWKDWREAHPDTTLLQGDPLYTTRYTRLPYSDQIAAGEQLYPVQPLAPETRQGGPDRFSFVAAVKRGPGWDVIQQPVETKASIPADKPVVYAMWFVWYANHTSALQ
jgi:Protein of unknown function (DUF3179)